MPYEITKKDLSEYLNVLKDKEVCGIGQNPDACLLASVLRWKYDKPFVVARRTFWERGHSQDTEEDIPQDMQQYLNLFDSLGKKTITRAEFKGALADRGLTL